MIADSPPSEVLPEEVAAALDALVGLACIKVTGGGAAGARVLLDLVRASEVGAVGQRRVSTLFICCPWTVSERSCGPSSLPQTKDQRVAELADLLVGDVLSGVAASEETWDLGLSFDRGTVLSVKPVTTRPPADNVRSRAHQNYWSIGHETQFASVGPADYWRTADRDPADYIW